MRQECLIILNCSIMFNNVSQTATENKDVNFTEIHIKVIWCLERAIDQGHKSCWKYKYKNVFTPSSLWVAVLINEGTNISGNMEKAGNVVVFPFKGDSLGLRHQTFPSLTSLLHKKHLEYLQIVCWQHCLGICVQTTYMVWRDMNMCTRTWFEIHKYVSVNIDHHMCVSKEGKY